MAQGKMKYNVESATTFADIALRAAQSSDNGHYDLQAKERAELAIEWGLYNLCRARGGDWVPMEHGRDSYIAS